MADIRDVLARHNRFQDSMLHSFESNLRDIVMRAQARTIVLLQSRLNLTEGVIESTPGNLRQLRAANALFMEELESAGYSRLVEAFVGEFHGTLPFLRETIELLGSQAGRKWDLSLSAKDTGLLAGVQANTVWQLENVLQSVSGHAITRGLFGVAGLRFESLVDLLTQKLQTSIGNARTIADTGMSTFYRTATDRAFEAIQKDLPGQTLRYRYSGPVDKLERPFCRHLTDADKSYSREEIGRMNNGMLPNVFLTGGGWNCRHQWILDTSELTRPVQVVEKGGQYRELQNSGLSKDKAQEVLSVLGRPEIADILRQRPIRRISIERSSVQGFGGVYDDRTKQITLNSVRRRGVNYGEAFVPGRTGNMSAATDNPMESLQRTLLQELAHHLEDTEPRIVAISDEAFYDLARRPITSYAVTPRKEYLAESFVAYMVERNALSTYDPVGFKMVEKVLAVLRESSK